MFKNKVFLITVLEIYFYKMFKLSLLYYNTHTPFIFENIRLIILFWIIHFTTFCSNYSYITLFTQSYTHKSTHNVVHYTTNLFTTLQHTHKHTHTL